VFRQPGADSARFHRSRLVWACTGMLRGKVLAWLLSRCAVQVGGQPGRDVREAARRCDLVSASAIRVLTAWSIAAARRRVAGSVIARSRMTFEGPGLGLTE
jgi:hypothetical protein